MAKMIHRRLFNNACAAICLTWLGGSRSAVASVIDIPQTPDQPLDQPVLLPLFPLNMVVFPGQSVFLHIFEPRYRELIGDCERDGITLGIAPLLNNGLASYGTEVRLATILRTDESGSMDVALEGRRVFQLNEFRKNISDKLYSGGMVRFQPNDSTYWPAIQEQLVSQFNVWQDRSGASPVLKGDPPENLSFAIAHHLGLSTLQKLQLIARSDETDRQAILLRHLEHVLANNPG